MNLGARGLHWWRIMTAAAFFFTLIATHWPKLTLGPEAPSDKVLHALTFGIVTFLLARARVINSLILLLGAMVLFATFDELTQALPFIQRHTSIADWIADCIGILVAVSVLGMKVRARDPLSQMRADLDSAAQAAVFDHPFNWCALATSATLGALVGFPLALMFEHTVFLDTRPWQTGFLGAVFFAIVALEISNRSACRAIIARLALNRQCFVCGSGATTTDERVAESGTCHICAHRWLRAQWVVPCELFGRTRRNQAVMSLQSGVRGCFHVIIALMSVGAVMALSAQYLVPRGVSMRVIEEIREMRDIIVYAVSILMVGLILRAMNVAHFRARAREGERCLSCDFDLCATTALAGVGRCPECATEFARFSAGAHALDQPHSAGGANPSGPVDGTALPTA